MPTLSEFTQLISALAAVGSLVFGIWNNWKIETVHKATNSMKDELVAAVAAREHARGVKDEQDAQAAADASE